MYAIAHISGGLGANFQVLPGIRNAMLKPFDVFKVEGKDVLWIGSTDTMEEARSKAKQQKESDPHCDYCVLDQQTGVIVRIPWKELD